MNYIEKYELKIDTELYKFVNNEVLPGTSVVNEDFWKGFSDTVIKLAPINKRLIEKRDEIQRKKEAFQKKRKGLMAKGQIKSKQ